MSTLRLYRVIVPVGDVESAAHFYGTLLGQPGARVSPGRHYFMCGDVTLALYSPRADGDERDPHPNFDHLYFSVEDLEEFHRRAGRLGALSTELGDGHLPMGEIATRPWGERSFYLKDPFRKSAVLRRLAHPLHRKAGVALALGDPYGNCRSLQ